MLSFFRRKKPQDGPDAAPTRPSTEELAAAFPRAPSEPLPAEQQARFEELARSSLAQQATLIRRLRQQVGFVFQNFNLFPHRTALENVIEGPIVVKKMPREQAIALGMKLLAKVGLV